MAQTDNTPRWTGPIPERCDICQGPLGDTFSDVKTPAGPWCIACQRCVESYGMKIGTGYGQRYLTTDGRKVAG